MLEIFAFSSKLWEIRESLPAEAVSWSRSEIDVAHKLRFGSPDSLPRVLLEFGVDVTQRGLLRLPFEKVIFEYDAPPNDRNYNRYAYLCHERSASEAWCEVEPDDLSERVIEITSLRRDARGWWRPLSPRPIVQSPRRTYAVPPIAPSKNKYYFEDYVLGDAAQVMMSCIALSASCFTTTEVIIPTKLQRAWSRAGKPILYDFKLVQLAATTSVRRPHIGTHASPVLHWRRGHYRRLTASGRLVPVAPCLVGDAVNGIVDKAYDARNMIRETFK
jgi:hypothetical protein